LFNINFILSKIKFNINYKKNIDVLANFKFYFNTDVSKKIYRIRHHLSHAFSSLFFINKNINSLIYSFDGSGDFSTIEVYLVDQSKCELIEKTIFPNSLGFLYTAFTQFLGFRSYGDEYKFMGLAGYGRPIYTKLIRKLFRSEDPFKLNMKYFNLPQVTHQDNKSPKINILYSKKFIDLFGSARESGVTDINQIHKDYAASMQKVFENIVLMHLKRLKKRYKSQKLYITGGCAFNSVLIGKIIETGLFESISIGPNPGDAGGAIGSAFFLLHSKNEKINSIQNTAFLGPSFDNEYIKKYIIDKIKEQNKYKIKFFKNFEDLAVQAALMIKKEKIIFWFQDKMEWGPRALGNRSILADPSYKNIKNLINIKIKKREEFRPFAAAVMKEFAGDYFYMNNYNSPFMNIVFRARENTKKLFPGVVHIDGTSRVQTVGEDDNKKFYKLLHQYNKMSNFPMLLNTSLNINAPIALSPVDAFKFFLETETNCIVLNNWIIELKH
jgi:carbamoyltransferase